MTERAQHAQHGETAAGPIMRQVGTHLRMAREERGEALHEVAAFLRIRRTYLEDLEAGDLEKIPGRAYALGFLRTYADHLGFDGDAIVEEIKRTDVPLPETPELRIREPLPESQRPPLMLVATSLVFAAMIYVGWSYWQDQREPAPMTGAPVPAELAARETAPATAPADATTVEPSDAVEPEPSPTAATEAETDVDLPPLPPVPEPPLPDADELAADPGATEVTSAPDPAAGEAAVSAILDDTATDPAAEAEATAATTDTADADAAEPAAPRASDVLAVIAAESGGGEPRAFGDQEAGGRVVLFANEASWVQIRSADRDYVWTRTMEPGDAFFVPNREDLALWTGNAGGLRVIVDGRPLAELGARGEVRRDIPLAADRLTSQYATN